MTTFNVLLVEDEKTLSRIVAQVLDRYTRERGLVLDLRIELDALHGLLHAHKRLNELDVVLLDIHMPKLGGDDIAESLAMLDERALSRILFVTSHPGDLAERFPDRSLSILTKPFRYGQLANALDRLRAGGLGQTLS